MRDLLRFFLGLGLGTLLTIHALAFGGVGHGSYVPLVLTVPLVPLIGIFAVLIGPFLWAFYFFLIPRLKKKRTRITTLAVFLFFHLAIGIWLAIGDPAFARALDEEWKGLLSFGLLFTVTISCLWYFALRDPQQVQ